MKKLLSILICALVPTMMFAYEVTFKATASVIGTGGTIGINASNSNSGVSFESTASHSITKSGKNGFLGYWSTEATFYYHAKADKGYVFTGWYKNDIGTESESANNPYSKKLSANSTGILSETDAPHYYAFFKQIIKPAYNEVVLYLYDDGTLSTFPLSMTLNKTTALSITDNSNGLLSITQNGTPSGAEGQEIQLNITNATSAVGQFTEGEDLFTITLTPSNSSITNTNTYNPEAVKISVSIVKVATITFTPPAAGGSYTYLQDNGLGQTIAVNEVKTATVMGAGNDKMFTLSVTDIAEGYRFRRWVINKQVGTPEYLYDKVAIHPIMSSATVTAEFVSTDYAQFIVLPDTAKHYAHMDDAFDAAKKLGKTVVSVYQPGYVTINTNGNGYATSFTKKMTKSEWILPKPASGTYVIPSGYTLLVPGLDKPSLTGTASTNNQTKYLGYTYLLGKSAEDNFVEVNPTPQSICKLIVESGTTIQVSGNLSVYSCLSSTQGYTGRPTGYGQIHLQNGSHIQVNKDAILHVMGYITGDSVQSSVIAKNGAVVYEAFQLTDWRGGTAMMTGNIVNNSREVFPDGQYYVQNIETLLEMEQGSKEYLTTAVDVSSPFPVTTEFVTTMTSGEDLGLFALGNGTKLQKYYDPIKDRLKIKLVGTGDNAAAELSYMYLEVKVLFVDYSLDSRNYVLPINNNIDVTIDNVKLTIPYKCAFMAGSSLTVTENSQLNIQNEIYVYDKELNVQPNDQTKGYNGSNDFPLKPITYTAYHNKAPNIRTANVAKVDPAYQTRYPAGLSDATFIINGTLTMEGRGALYTTTYGSAITSGVTRTSENDLIRDFGANITSTGSGVMNFNSIGTKQTTNQISQPGTDVSWVTNIPVCNAWLRNSDGTRSAGTEAKEGETYMYIDGFWVVPDADLRNPQGNKFYLTLPANKTQNVVSEVIANGVTISSIAKVSATGTQFEVGNPTLSGDTLTIPVTYKHTGIHNVDNPNIGKIVLKIDYVDPLVGAKTKNVEIPLEGIENYQPAYAVAIINANGDTLAVKNGDSYAMNTMAGVPVSSTVIITPSADNVAQSLNSTGWISNVAAPFAFEYGTIPAAKMENTLSYSPAEEGTHTSTLTLKASYKDKASNAVDSTIVINLTGTAIKQPSSLKFMPHLTTLEGDTIFQGQEIAPLFENRGNTKDITFTFDGNSTHDLVTISKDGDNYKLVANIKDDVHEPQTIEITAIQEADGAMLGNTVTIKLTILPPAAWNWGVLYFNSTTTTIPVITESTESWTLELETDPAGLITSLEPDATNGYVATIGTPADPTQTYTATFRFKQGTYSKVFTSIIYADPRILSYCVDIERTFNDVTRKQTTTGVSFDDATNTITFAPAAVWEVEMKGTPYQLSFTPNGDNAWRVLERANATDEWSVLVPWTSSFVGGQEQTFTLKPNTSFVQIQYGAQTENVGTITNLCISKLDIAADMSKLYLPIYYKTTEASTKNIVLTHTNAATPTITLASPLTYTATTSENLGTADEPYYTTTVAISAAHTTPEGTYAFTATQGTKTVSVAVRTYNFPQELPIKWAEDPAERYYFETVESRYAQWNENTKELLLQNPGSQQKRSVTFAFNGAPSVITFDLSKEVVDAHWTIEESVDGNSFGINPNGRDSLAGNTLTHQLNYTTRYVRVTYNADLTEEVTISNLVIEGYPQAIVVPQNMFFTTDTKQQRLFMIAINLQEVDFEIDNSVAFSMTTDTTFATGWTNKISATEDTHESALGINKVDTIFLGVQWLEKTALDEGNITIRNKADNSILAIVSLLGSDSYLVKDKANNTGIYTGIPDGKVDPEKNYTYNGNVYTDYQYHLVNLTNAFATDGTAMFDYLFIFGETTAPDGETNITLPKKGSSDGSTNVGSNAITPLFVYKKAPNANNEYKGYQYVGKVDNVNTAEKAIVGKIIVKDTAGTVYVNVQDTALRVYMTGFAPYATTGHTKNQEGVFLFRGTHSAKLDLYLEDFHVSSRNKTMNGNGFYGDKEGGDTYSESYARGSGGVLVFENMDAQEELQYFQPFDVSIHTTGNNLLNSNHGCFFALQVGNVTAMKAYQVSSPIQVHMHTKEHARKTKTTLNFDDIWPTAVNASNEITDSKRTNGFLALKKQANNAPSIDLGNPYTEVNFKGGQIELQNSQIGSDTYKTTLAISYRAGFFGADEAGIELCHGIGTDAVDGTVNFIDGTITVEKMKVAEAYRQYYLMDTLPDGSESEYTSCLRTPKNTFVTGGSLCRIRACQHVTSKGGAPKDTKNGSLLGQYVYTMQPTDEIDEVTKLVKKIAYPSNIDNLADYQERHGYEYGLNSVTPDANDKLYFWIPAEFGVEVEKDVFMATWKACMTKIGAGIANVADGEIGGDIVIDANEEVKYFLYCQLDKNIHDVISASVGEGKDKQYTYQAPIEVPAAAKEYFKGSYTRWAPNLVGKDPQHQVLSDTTYSITDRVYYITTATADIWKTFTAPFDVAKIYVVESYSEDLLEKAGNRTQILEEQAKHNADFAAFFAVAMAMGTDKSFDGIYQSYRKWATIQDRDSLGIWHGEGDYTPLRSMQELIPYVGNNWREANFYLNENTDNWTLNEANSYDTKWKMLTPDSLTKDILLHKGRTYSLLFPYCTSCESTFDDRDYWDYWSGKFLIFESTEGKQTINGRDFLNEAKANNIFTNQPTSTETIVTGNSTFADLQTSRDNLFLYEENLPLMNSEMFLAKPVGKVTIKPTTAFLYGDVPTSASGAPARKVTRTGQIIYDKQNTPTDNQQGGMPTVGGGNDLFITETANGINIAVAAPQHVRVLSSTGAVLYSGMVHTAVDVAIPVTGVYVVTGANEVHKILY